MIKNNHIITNLKYILLSGVMLISACSKDEEVASNTDRFISSDVVTFNINPYNNWTPDIIDGMGAPSVSGASNRAVTRSEALPMDCENGEAPATEIYMYMIEEDCPPVVDTLQLATRAGSGTSATIGVYAFQSDTEDYIPSPDNIAEPFMNNINLSDYGTESNPYKYWPGSGSWLKFFAYMPYVSGGNIEGVSVENVGNQAKFSYQVPVDITKQQDLMDGSSRNIEGNLTSVVEISLSHIMSQIQVKAGTLDEGVITSISFKNIYTKGDRIMASADGWTVDTDSKADYTQTFTEENPPKGDEIGLPMYLMPQTLSDDAEIEIKMYVTSVDPTDESGAKTRTHEYTLTKQLKQFVATWIPDKKYTYVISTPLEVELEVTDNVVGNVKKDLQIQNTGLSTAYVRVAMIGNWVIPNETEDYKDDVIVADWSENDGEFNWGKVYTSASEAKANKGWYKHTDGYFYYMEPVARGKFVPEQLFETYTLLSSPVAGAVLDLTIVAQAVYHEDMPIAWPGFAAVANL